MAEVVNNDSLGVLIRGILTDIRSLIREEVELARLEVKDQLGRARTAATALAIAAVCLAFGGTFILIALATGIADLLNWPVWAGFLAVAVVLSVAGLILLSSARKRLRGISGVPEETVSTLKENSEWIAKRLSSAQR